MIRLAIFGSFDLNFWAACVKVWMKKRLNDIIHEEVNGYPVDQWIILSTNTQ